MKLGELKQKIDAALAAEPKLAEAVVLVDTEARCFPVHMIEATGFWVEDEEFRRGLGRDFCSITLNYTGAPSWHQD